MSNLVNPQIVVRPAQEGDTTTLAACLAPDIGLEQLEQRWQEHQARYRQMLVAELDGQVVGTISLGGLGHHRPDSLRMFALDVGGAIRRRGIGSTLIAAVEEEARRRGLKTAHLEVATENADAVRLYEHLGYQREGEPIIDRWTRLDDDGNREQVEELSWVMVKRL